jgi:hypothetical protein
MKNRKLNFIKLGILLFGISLFMWNCENDVVTNQIESTTNHKKDNYNLEKINYEKLLKDKEVQHSLKLLENKFSDHKQQQNLYSRETSQVADGLTLITDEINKITVNQTISWTFQVEIPVLESSDFENFMIKKHNDVFSYFLISYKLSDVESLETDYEEVLLYEISEEYLSLDNLDLASRGAYIMDDVTQGGGSPCEGKVIQICSPCYIPSYKQNGGSTCHGPALQNDKTLCTGTGSYLYTILDFSDCEQGTYNPPSGPTGGSSDSDVDNRVNVPSVGGTTNNSGNPTVTSPLTLECDNCSNSLSLISYLNLTDKAQIDWVNNANNSQTVTNLYNFGDANQWDENTTTISLQVLNALSNTNNIDLSFGENITVQNKANEIFDIIANNNFSNIDQYSLADQKIIAQNSLFISFLPNLKDLGIELPQTEEEWAEFGEILVEVMYEIIPDLIPGIAELNSLKNSISAFNNGSYIDGSTELAFAIIGIIPAGKVLKALAKFTKLAKKATKIFKTYIKLFKLNKPLAKGFKKVIKDSNKMNKIFGNVGHNLDNLVAKAGGEKEALIKVSERIQELKLSDQIPLIQPNGWAGRFDNIDVLGEKLSIQIYKSADGSLINIADMWKP